MKGARSFKLFTIYANNLVKMRQDEYLDSGQRKIYFFLSF